MRAISYTQYGGPEVLQMVEIEKPSPKDDEVLIKIAAVSINDWDFDLLKGDFVNRIINGLFKPKRKILGSDVAGRIEAVGKKIKTFKVGDEVYGDLSGSWGGFAEYVCAKEKLLAIKPASMSFSEAAAIPQAALLAVQGLIDIGKIHSGQKILINGAGGGVGTFAVQIARSYNAEVTGVDSAGKLDMLRSIGCAKVMDYTREDVTKKNTVYDVILDVKTKRSIFDYFPILSPSGVYITIGGSMGRILQTLISGMLIPLFSNKKIRMVVLKANKDLVYMNELYISGKVKPVIDGPYTLDQFGEAFQIISKGEHKGKVVLTM